MSEAAALRYLSALAPTSGEAPRRAVSRRSDLAPLGWLDPKAMLTGGDEDPPLVGRTARLDRLVAVDRLHSGERLLRVGWLWLAGHDELAEDRFLAPLVSVPVALEVRGDGYRPQLLADAELTGLVDHPGVRDILEDALPTAFTLAGPSPPQEPILGRYTGFKAWLRQVTDEVGVLTPDVVAPDRDPWELGSWPRLGLGLAVCIYLARDLGRPTIAADLANWAGRDVSATAFAALYGSDEAEAEAVDSRTGIISSFPVNDEQRSVVLRARRERVTVVSGPPGTGKSHTAAALSLDEVGGGHSVLLAAQSDHAVDVLAALLDRHPGPRFVRFGSLQHRRQVAEELAGGMATPYSDAETDRFEERLAVATDRLLSARSRIARLLGREQAFTAALAERERMTAAFALAPGAAAPGFDPQRAAELLAAATGATGLFAEKRRDRAEIRLRQLLAVDPAASLADLDDAVAAGTAEATVRLGLAGGGLTLGAEWEELLAAEAAWRDEVGAVLESRRRSRENRRRVSTRAVSALASALRAGRARRRRMLRELDATEFLDVLPLWLGTLREIDDTLPAEPGMFDVVILDEASQIDQMRAAPALCRARRAVVLGDPRQLRHVSFVSDDRAEAAASAEGLSGDLARQLDVRRNSLFDAAVAVSPVTELVEHYRSVPHIIGFSDRRFYGERLRLMTQHPGSDDLDAIHVVAVNGTRNESGWIEAEVDAAAVEVRAAIDAGVTSIGVVSPFRAQADALEEMLLDRFTDAERRAGGLRVGTVHSFQGNERDLVVATLGLGEEDTAGSLSFVQDPHLFNVLVTRARRRMVVITALDRERLPSGLLAEYLRWEAEPPVPGPPAGPASGWIAELQAHLADYAVPVTAEYRIAGYTMDLVVGGGADAVGVECSVFAGDPERHIERHLALHRAGWRLRDAFRSRWLASPEGAVAELVSDLLERQVTATGPIRPAGQ